MNKQWLHEIEALVKAEVISEETAQRIMAYYKLRPASNNLTFILAILGAVLISSGIILIAAHNWDEMSSLVKTIISFLPLLAAQVLCAYTLLKQRDKMVWRECSSVFLFFAIGASISLISQIYQVSGSLYGFLLTWMLLALPLVYLLSSSTVALLCIGGMTWYAGLLGYDISAGPVPVMYAVVMLALVPHYYKLYTTRPGSNYLNLLNWFLVISVTISLGSFTKGADRFEWIFVLYCILFCIYYFIGRLTYFQGKRLIANPFLLVGLVGVLVILMIWSFDFLWDDFSSRNKRVNLFRDPLPYLIITALVAVTGLAWTVSKRQNEPDPTGFSFAVFLILIAGLTKHPTVAVLAVNAWIFIIALYFIRKGSREDHLGILNFGLLVLAALAVCRFFDDTIPFIWRGIFFVATGIGFFIANYLMLQKRKKLKIQT